MSQMESGKWEEGGIEEGMYVCERGGDRKKRFQDRRVEKKGGISFLRLPRQGKKVLFLP